MRVLVTGADGYIGRGVVQRLLDDGVEVDARGLAPTGLSHPLLSEQVGDVFGLEFEGNDVPDAVLHLAWRNGFVHNDPSHLEDLPRHYAFLKRCVEAGVRHVAVMGSMHEVGYHEGVVCEDTPCRPTTPYGVSKNALRQLCQELCRQHDVTFQWLRGFYLVSNDGRGSSVFAKIVQAAREGKKEFPFTSGTCKYDFLPYDEFCLQVASAVEQTDVDGIINVCSGEPVALGEYTEGFIRENDLDISLAYGRYPDRPYDSPAIWGDNSKIEAILAQRETSHE